MHKTIEPVKTVQVLHCSFCGKSQKEVNKLIAGPIAVICDECVCVCQEYLDEMVTSPKTLSTLQNVVMSPGAFRSAEELGNLQRKVARGDRHGVLARFRRLVGEVMERIDTIAIEYSKPKAVEALAQGTALILQTARLLEIEPHELVEEVVQQTKRSDTKRR